MALGNEVGDRRVAAFFDVDGTLVKSTIVHYYVYLRRRLLARPYANIWHLMYVIKYAWFLLLDKIDRCRLNIVFYRDYRGLSVARIKGQADQCYAELIAPRRFQQGLHCVQEHQQAGDLIVLVTGSLDFLTQPLAEALGINAIIAASLVESEGTFTGELAGPPIGGLEKAVRVRRFAKENGIDLSRSHGYGDSVADLPMLEAVGFPHAVNPDRSLARIARTRGWPRHRWTAVAGTAKTLAR